MFCTSCGNKIDDQVRFCPGCGAPQSNDSAADSITAASNIPEYPQSSLELADKYASLSIDDLIAQADGENPIAWVMLGSRYQDGNGVAQDNQKAFDWYKKAADAGEAWGINNLGLCYEYEWGTKKDVEQAALYYRQAAEKGLPAAIANFGNYLQYGTGVEKSLEDAIQWFRLGANRGGARSQYSLALCFRDAIGVEQDDSKAVYWFQKAAKQNNSDALLGLGWMYENGRGVEKDPARGHELYLESAGLENAVAMGNVALDYKVGRGVDKDLIKANEWYRKAADAGSVKGMFNLACNYEYGIGVAKSWDEAKQWYERAAEEGHKEAEFRARFRRLEFRKRKYKSKSGVVRFHRTSGTVLETKRSSETHVSSSGGGGYVGRHGGVVNAPQVRSQVVTTDDFWLENENGGEEHISFTNKNISLRNGQKISLFHAIAGHKEKGPYLTLLNHNDGNVFSLKSAGSFWSENMPRGLSLGFLKTAIVGGSVFFLTATLLPQAGAYISYQDLPQYLHPVWDELFNSRLSRSGDIPIIAAWGSAALYFVYKLIRRIQKSNAGSRAVEVHLNAIKDWAAQQG